ncbi:TetR/AcrR family transcriptional regulator [Mycobacterium sp. pW049]|uniref:TetR/AcrR family transcriptional regulator n=1 Tax=[Mycobacterium] bulgaricum TaxID=3238985 RepID=UPI00351ACB16
MTTPRTRRSSDEVRNLMLDSARELFRSQGYAATSTKSISDHAGVSESMLFRHFGSKSAIFEESVLRPFLTFVEAFVGDWSNRAPADVVPELLADTYIDGLYRLCRNNIDLLVALSDSCSDEQGLGAARQASTLIQEHLTELANQVQQYHDDIGLTPAMDPQMAVRLTVAIVVGTAHLGPGFFDRISERLTSDVAAFVVRGAGYPGSG